MRSVEFESRNKKKRKNKTANLQYIQYKFMCVFVYLCIN